jgi:hypothetical protein
VDFDPAYSQSIADGEIFTISSSVADYVAPNLDLIKSFNLGDYTSGSGAAAKDISLSTFVYNQFNSVGGATVYTPFYNPNSGSFNFSAFTSNNSIFSVTGSNSVAIQFKVTESVPPNTLTTYFVGTGSSAADTANNISNVLTSVSYSTFGTLMSVVTQSASTILSFTSSLSAYDITNFKINTTSIFSNVTSGSVPSVPKGNSHIYFRTTSKRIAGGTDLFISASVTQSVPTVYIQSNINPALNNKLLSNNLTTITTRISSDYGAEAGVGGSYDIKKGVLNMSASVQTYDLNAWAADSASLDNGDIIEVRKIFYEEEPAIVRYFDPYAGTGTGIQSLLETFGFGQMSPGINFMLMPIFFDVQKVQAIELNDQIRKAAYSFDLQNNQLKIFPIPTHDHKLFFDYVSLKQKSQVVRDTRPNVVTDIMNVPYRNPIYSNINAVGRLWILKYTLGLCREIEAHIRIQSANLSISGVGPLQGSELITDARTEKENLINELKEMLNEVSRKSQLERKQMEAGFTRDTLINIPATIYIM